jgi:hypothetical protein
LSATPANHTRGASSNKASSNKASRNLCQLHPPTTHVHSSTASCPSLQQQLVVIKLVAQQRLVVIKLVAQQRLVVIKLVAIFVSYTHNHTRALTDSVLPVFAAKLKAAAGHSRPPPNVTCISYQGYPYIHLNITYQSLGAFSSSLGSRV